ncbi:hypothetical protein RQP46_011105 [Phenoliferia psychrophenolica]
MSTFDASQPYDPPLKTVPNRRRSASFSGSTPTAPVFRDPRRQSTISTGPVPSLPPSYHDDTDSSVSGDQSDGVGEIRRDAKVAGVASDDDFGDPIDEAEDAKIARPGRMSKGCEKPGTVHSSDMEEFLAQLYDMTHSIDALDNDLDDIKALRKKITKISPEEDVGQVSIKADLDALASLTTDSGKAILSLETWLTALYARGKNLRALVKSGSVDFTPEEVGEVKFQISSAKLDFADAMERIRDEAWKEQERRQRIRIKMARHIRWSEPGITDSEIKSLLKAAELGAADGVAANDVTSYAGLWALHNPFTELSELTNGMRFLDDDLDREIIDQAVSSVKPNRKQPSNPKSSLRAPTKSRKSRGPPPPAPFFGSRLTFLSASAKIKPSESSIAEKDLPYTYAQERRLERANRRKKIVITLLVIIILGLILLVFFATMGASLSF